MDAFEVRHGDARPQVVRVAGKWHAQVVRMSDGAIYDSAPIDTRAEAIDVMQSLVDNVMPEGTQIFIEPE